MACIPSSLSPGDRSHIAPDRRTHLLHRIHLHAVVLSLLVGFAFSPAPSCAQFAGQGVVLRPALGFGSEGRQTFLTALRVERPFTYFDWSEPGPLPAPSLREALITNEASFFLIMTKNDKRFIPYLGAEQISVLRDYVNLGGRLLVSADGLGPDSDSSVLLGALFGFTPHSARCPRLSAASGSGVSPPLPAELPVSTSSSGDYTMDTCVFDMSFEGVGLSTYGILHRGTAYSPVFTARKGEGFGMFIGSSLSAVGTDGGWMTLVVEAAAAPPSMFDLEIPSASATPSTSPSPSATPSTSLSSSMTASHSPSVSRPPSPSLTPSGTSSISITPSHSPSPSATLTPGFVGRPGLILLDPSYIDGDDEGSKTANTLDSRSVEYDVSSSWSAAVSDLDQRKFLLIPEPEVAAPPPDSRIISYVQGGGVLVIQGSSNSRTFLNNQFSSSYGSVSSSSCDSPAALRRPYPLPASLPNSNAVSCISTSSFIHEVVYGSDSSQSVSVFSVGAGVIIWLAFDWWEIPTPTGWADVLEWAVSSGHTSSRVSRTPTPSPSPSGVPVDYTIFLDSAYVDLDREAPNLQTDLAAAGYISSSSFVDPNGITPSSLAASKLFVIPELEKGSLSFSASSSAAIRSFVRTDGGTILLVGDHSGRYLDVLTSLFEWDLGSTATASCGSSTLVWTPPPELASLYAFLPATLPGSNAVYCFTASSIPANMTPMYRDSGRIMAFVAEEGAGRVVFIAFDWYERAGIYEWKTLLSLVNPVLRPSPGPPSPSPSPSPSGSPSPSAAPSSLPPPPPVAVMVITDSTHFDTRETDHAIEGIESDPDFTIELTRLPSIGSFDLAAYSGMQVVVLPENENTALSSALFASSLYDYATGGGTVLQFSDSSLKGPQFVASAFGFSATPSFASCSGFGYRASVDFSSPLYHFQSSLPSSVPSVSGTYCISDSSLPAGATVLYSSSSDVYAYWVPVGSGAYVFLAADMFTSDGAWNQVAATFSVAFARGYLSSALILDDAAVVNTVVIPRVSPRLASVVGALEPFDMGSFFEQLASSTSAGVAVIPRPLFVGRGLGAALTSEQRTALRGFLGRGGHLVLLGGSFSLRLIHDVLGLEVTPTYCTVPLLNATTASWFFTIDEVNAASLATLPSLNFMTCAETASLPSESLPLYGSAGASSVFTLPFRPPGASQTGLVSFFAYDFSGASYSSVIAEPWFDVIEHVLDARLSARLSQGDAVIVNPVPSDRPVMVYMNPSAVDTSREGTNTRSAISASTHTVLSLSDFNTYRDASYVLVVPELELGTADLLAAGWTDSVRSFVSDGGRVIFHAPNSLSNSVLLSWFDMSVTTSSCSGPFAITEAGSAVLAEPHPDSLPPANLVTCMDVPPDAEALFLGPSGGSAVIASTPSSSLASGGSVVVLGFDFFELPVPANWASVLNALTVPYTQASFFGKSSGVSLSSTGTDTGLEVSLSSYLLERVPASSFAVPSELATAVLGAPFVAVPALTEPLGVDLESLIVMREYLSGGGSLLFVGDALGNSISTINLILGSGLSHDMCAATASLVATTGLAAAFVGSPSTISADENTFCLDRDSLPASAVEVYTANAVGSTAGSTWVFVAPFGAGSVTYLPYSMESDDDVSPDASALAGASVASNAEPVPFLPPKDDDSGISGGAIAGIVIGVLVLVALVVFAVVAVLRSRRGDRAAATRTHRPTMRGSARAPAHPSQAAPSPGPANAPNQIAAGFRNNAEATHPGAAYGRPTDYRFQAAPQQARVGQHVGSAMPYAPSSPLGPSHPYGAGQPGRAASPPGAYPTNAYHGVAGPSPGPYPPPNAYPVPAYPSNAGGPAAPPPHSSGGSGPGPAPVPSSPSEAPPAYPSGAANPARSTSPSHAPSAHPSQVHPYYVATPPLPQSSPEVSGSPPSAAPLAHPVPAVSPAGAPEPGAPEPGAPPALMPSTFADGITDLNSAATVEDAIRALDGLNMFVAERPHDLPADARSQIFSITLKLRNDRFSSEWTERPRLALQRVMVALSSLG